MKLSQYMRLFGITEHELARQAGVSQPVINRMRRGVGNWTMALMHKVAEATDGDVTMADIVAGYIPEPPKATRGRKPLAKVTKKAKPAKEPAKRGRGRPRKDGSPAQPRAKKPAVKRTAAKKSRAKGKASVRAVA